MTIPPSSINSLSSRKKDGNLRRMNEWSSQVAAWVSELAHKILSCSTGEFPRNTVRVSRTEDGVTTISPPSSVAGSVVSASIPSSFQPKSGVDTRATYSLKPDGTVHVLNETWSDGKRGSIEGTAYKADPGSDEAKLKVKFYVPPFLPIIPVVGDYWVLYIDEDYQYALIGQPSRKYLWILCRQPHLDEEIYNQLVEKAKSEGYDDSKLKKTTQSDPPPEGDNSPSDTKGIWWIKSIFGK